jgi:uncharacterized protein (TIGR03435 family)
MPNRAAPPDACKMPLDPVPRYRAEHGDMYMIRMLAVAALLCLWTDDGRGQNLANPPKFEVAAVKPCEPGTPEPPGQRMGMVRYIYPGGRFDAKAVSVEFLLEWAYDLLPSQHSRGPAWMENERFDIVAKAAGNATDDQMKLMAQALLAERFKLKSHVERREGPVLLVTLGKAAPKLFPPKDGEAHALRIVPQTDSEQKVVSYRVVATRFSFAQLNQTFARQLERVIVNATGLDGDFDFTLAFTPDENRPNPLDPSLIINAMREQLGLNVKAQTGPVDYLVIDSVEKVPEGN